jgi:hypothetical protein
MRQALGQHRGLLENLLGHEVLVAGLVDLRGLCGDPDHLAVDLPSLGVADLGAAAGDKA